MDILWGGMLLTGIIYGAFAGTMPEITDAVISSSKEAITLCITMAGVMAVWVGIMEIAKDSGLMEKLAKAMRPLIRFLFPRIPQGHPAEEHITANCLANFLGLGWAATPAGLKAMEALEALEETRRAGPADVPAVPRGTASNEMCNFLILNISSLQLIPVTIIAYRSQYGSASPTAVVGPAIVATALNTVLAILFCKFMDRRKRRA